MYRRQGGRRFGNAALPRASRSAATCLHALESKTSLTRRSRTSANKRGTSAPPSKSGYARIAPRRCACASACTRLSPAPASGRPSRRPLDRKHIQRHASQSPHPPSCDAHNLAPLPPRAPVAPDARATLAASRRKCPASPAHRRGPRWQPWRGRCRVSRRTDT